MTSVITHVDMDGFSSAALVNLQNSNEARIFPINYGNPVPFDKLRPGEVVYMLDFTATPEEMVRLNSEYDLIWIDHHLEAFNEVETIIGKDVKGLRADGSSACILTWIYLYPKIKPPISLQWLDAYDTGKFTIYPEVLPFQKGLWAMDVFPIGHGKMTLWHRILYEPVFQQQIIDRGQILIDADKSAFRNKCRFMVEEIDFHGYKALLANFSVTDGSEFESIVNPERHQLLIGYYKYSKLNLDGTYTKHWKFSVRAVSGCTVNIAKLLMEHYPNGGGHAGAGGFTVDYLEGLPYMSNITTQEVKKEIVP